MKKYLIVLLFLLAFTVNAQDTTHVGEKDCISQYINITKKKDTTKTKVEYDPTCGYWVYFPDNYGTKKKQCFRWLRKKKKRNK